MARESTPLIYTNICIPNSIQDTFIMSPTQSVFPLPSRFTNSQCHFVIYPPFLSPSSTHFPPLSIPRLCHVHVTGLRHHLQAKGSVSSIDLEEVVAPGTAALRVGFQQPVAHGVDRQICPEPHEAGWAATPAPSRT